MEQKAYEQALPLFEAVFAENREIQTFIQSSIQPT
jgi:hypothetical protein